MGEADASHRALTQPVSTRVPANMRTPADHVQCGVRQTCGMLVHVLPNTC
jgi:hypothetical protein